MALIAAELSTLVVSWKEAAEIQELYLSGKKMEAAMAVPDDLADEISLTGPKERIRQRLQAWEESPVTGLIVGVRNPEEMETYAELVMGA